MVHYFCFIQSQGELHPDSRVFKVKVGESFRDQTKSSLIENFAADLGWYYHEWDKTTDDRLIQATCGNLVQLNRTGYVFNTIEITINALYRHLQDNTLDSVQPSTNYIKNQLKSSAILFPAFQTTKNNPIFETRAYLAKRKNLSFGDDSDFYKAVAGFTCIAFLFILGALLETLERTF